MTTKDATKTGPFCIVIGVYNTRGVNTTIETHGCRTTRHPSHAVHACLVTEWPQHACINHSLWYRVYRRINWRKPWCKTLINIYRTSSIQIVQLQGFWLASSNNIMDINEENGRCPILGISTLCIYRRDVKIDIDNDTVDVLSSRHLIQCTGAWHPIPSCFIVYRLIVEGVPLWVYGRN